MTIESDTYRILAVLAPGEADSGEILERLRRWAPGGAPSLATFYRRLKQMLDAGWVEALEARPEGPGRPAQRFALTPAGLALAREEAARWRDLGRLLLDPGGRSG